MKTIMMSKIFAMILILFGSDHCQPPQYTVNHPIFNAHNDFRNSQIELFTSQNKIIEQMTQLTSMCEMTCQIVQKKLEEKQIEEEQAAKAQNRKLPVCYDDDNDEEESNSLKDNNLFELPPCFAVTPSEPIDSLSMGDEHLDTILATESDEFIKSSVEYLILILSESEGIPEHKCDVPSNDYSPPLDISTYQFEDFSESNNEVSSIDDDSFSIDNTQVPSIQTLPSFPQSKKKSNLKKSKLLKAQNWKLSVCYDDDDDEERSNSLKDNIISGLTPCFAITPNEPVLSTEEPDNSLSMRDEHLDTIPATKSDEFIKSSVENLIPIPSESEGIPEQMCDVPFHDNSPPLDVLKDQFEDFSESNDEFSSIDDDSFSIDKIDYVKASSPDSELVSSEVMEIFIPKVGGIDDDILLTIKDDILLENLLNVNHLFAKIEA
nr:hypothetical protein [Tanacetum cinerariifolium]